MQFCFQKNYWNTRCFHIEYIQYVQYFVYVVMRVCEYTDPVHNSKNDHPLTDKPDTAARGNVRVQHSTAKV